MKILFPSTGENLDSEMDNRFARADWFVVVDTETMESYALWNGEKEGGHGVGRVVAQYVMDAGVDMVVAPQIGPKAMSALESAGVRTITGKNGIIRRIVEDIVADQ
ncbi:MAG: NifB/NifX family molybdenum-iron cluster-binding protein [Candidatus Marinimicrobia bacterium]|nr:NifB/NifX family molybdenum-iron cluster-binding protein [Candidatus Neomarinimicrobiota bacterium]